MSKTKRLLALLLSVVMIMAMVPAAFAAELDEELSAYDEAIQTLYALGIMVGDKDTGEFRPSDNIKRSEFAKIAVVALGLEDAANTSDYKTAFPDVVSNH